MFEFRGLGELGIQFRDEARHLFLEGFAVVLYLLGTDKATRGEDIAVHGNPGGGSGFAEAGDVLVGTARRAVASGLRFCGWIYRWA